MAFYVKILHIFFMLKEIKPTFSVATKQGNTNVVKIADLDVLGSKVIPVSNELKKQPTKMEKKSII